MKRTGIRVLLVSVGTVYVLACFALNYLGTPVLADGAVAEVGTTDLDQLRQDIEAEIEELEARVEDVESKVETEERIAALAASLAAIEASVEALDAEVTELEAQLDNSAPDGEDDETAVVAPTTELSAEARCRANPTAAAALALGAGGESASGTTLVSEALSATPATIDPACAVFVLELLSQESLSDRIGDGISLGVRAVRHWESPFTLREIDADSEPNPGLTGGSRATVRATLWVVPLLVFLFGLREIIIAVLDRRPGPVDVLAVRSVSPEKPGEEQTDSRFRARVARHLDELSLAPRPFTAGGVGEVVVPVVEPAESAGGVPAVVAGFARRLLLPEHGYEVSSVISGPIKGEWQVTIELRTRRGGELIKTKRLTAPTPELLAAHAAAVIYIEVSNVPKVRPAIPMWGRWTNDERLRDFVSLEGRHTLKDLDKLIAAEPGSLHMRLQKVAAHGRAAEAHHYEGNPIRVAEQLRSQTDAALSAVQLAPSLVEPRVQLAIALSLSELWLGVDASPKGAADDRATLDRIKGWLDRDRSMRSHWVALAVRHEIGSTKGSNLGQPGLSHRRLELQQFLVRLSGVLGRDCVSRSRWYRLVLRWRRRHLRSSMPLTVLWPVSARRTAGILHLRTFEHHAYLKAAAMSVPPIERGRRVHGVRLRLLAWRCDLQLRSPHAMTRYNLALCFAYLAKVVPVRRKEAAKDTALRLLDRAHTHPLGSLTRDDLDTLLIDSDFVDIKTEIDTWLENMGLPKKVELSEPTTDAWQRLVDVSQAWAASWEQLLVELRVPATSWADRRERSWKVLARLEEDLAGEKALRSWITGGGDPYRPPAIPNASRVGSKVTVSKAKSAGKMSVANPKLVGAVSAATVDTLRDRLDRVEVLSHAEALAFAEERAKDWFEYVTRLRGLLT